MAAFCPFFGCSELAFFQASVQDGGEKAFWSDVESILEGSGKVWGGFWEGLGKILEDFSAFQEVLGRFWTSLKRFGLAGADFLNRTPALIREASQ